MVLADTSIWVEFLRRKTRVSGDQLLRVVTCGPVLQEVLQGITGDPFLAPFQDALMALRRLEDPVETSVFLEAAAIYRNGRRKGFTIRSGVDCLIAAIAIRHDIPVWHKDRDFETIARFTPLRTRTGSTFPTRS